MPAKIQIKEKSVIKEDTVQQVNVPVKAESVPEPVKSAQKAQSKTEAPENQKNVISEPEVLEPDFTIKDERPKPTKIPSSISLQ